MLGPYHLFPLLKGWEFKGVPVRRTVNRGETIEARKMKETGWLISITEITNDAYGALSVEYQGAGLETEKITVYPELSVTLGTWNPNPAGWGPRYYRPNPYSTAGYYYLIEFLGGFYGSPFPYIPSVKVSVSLLEDSTQESATIRGTASKIAITDINMFITSLRRLLSSKSSKVIDRGLLSPESGPAVSFESLKQLLEQVEKEKGR